MYLRPPPEERKKTYKKGLDGGEARRRREDDLVVIRKTKRNEGLNRLRSKRRAPQSFDIAIDSGTKVLLQLPQMVEGLLSENSDKQIVAATQFRKLLACNECFPHTEEAIKARVIARLVEFLSRHELPKLQLEATWAITILAFEEPEQIAFLIEQDAVLKLVRLLSSLHGDVRLQAGLALGNIASTSPSFRDVILGHGALLPLLAQFSDHSHLKILSDLTWVLYNLCCGIPSPPFEQIKPIFQILPRVICSTDEIILTNVCWILHCLSIGSIDGVQSVLEGRMLPRLIELLSHPSPEVTDAAFSTICNILDGNDVQTQFVVDGGVLPVLLQLLLQNQVKTMKIKACKAISSIMSRKTVHIQAIIDANIIYPLVQLMQHAEFHLKKEAARAITNATFGASLEQIHYLVNQGCVKPLCDLLECLEPTTVRICLDGLDNIMKAGQREKEQQLGRTPTLNPYLELIEICGGFNKMENLSDEQNDENYKKKVQMMEMYCHELQDEAISFYQIFGEL